VKRDTNTAARWPFVVDASVAPSSGAAASSREGLDF